MALVTDEDRQVIQGIVEKANEAAVAALALRTVVDKVRARIKDVDMNSGTDFAIIAQAYTPDYDAKLGELKVIVQELPRWDAV